MAVLTELAQLEDRRQPTTTLEGWRRFVDADPPQLTMLPDDQWTALAGDVWFPRFSRVFEDWFDLADQEGRLCCQHRGNTRMSCASARCGCIGSHRRGRRFGGWVSS